MLDRCAELLAPRLSLDLRTLLYPPARDASGRADCFDADGDHAARAVRDRVRAARLWMEWGVQPAAMIGHSIGELVAACVAGVFSLEDGLELVAERGRLMQAVAPGAMVAVYLPEAELRSLLPSGLDLAAANEAGLCVASGPTDEIEEFEQRLADGGVQSQRLHTSHAFHSRMMDEVVDEFAAAVGGLSPAPPRIPYVSNVTGDWITAEQATSPEYWAQQLRRSVRFADGLRPLLADPGAILLEVGPGQTLCSFARRHPDRDDAQLVLPSLPRPQESVADDALALETLGRLWLAGVPVDWQGMHAGTPSPTSPSARVPVRAPSLLGGCRGARAERAGDRAEGARRRRLVLRADVGVRARSVRRCRRASRSSGSCSARATSSGARSPAGCSMPVTT